MTGVQTCALPISTGAITVYDNAGGANNDNTGSFINDLGNGVMYAAIHLDNNSEATDTWEGADVDLFCVEFVKTGGFGYVDDAVFGIDTIYYSTTAGRSDAELASQGTYSTTKNTIYTGYLKFWKDLQGIDGTGGAYNVTARILQNSPRVLADVADANGRFDYDFGTYGPEFVIAKQVDNDADMSVLPEMYSAYDAFLAAKVITNDLTYLPKPYEILAMDVNLDGVVSAGDISQIMQRSVKAIDEFIDKDDTPSSDWRWINENTPNEDLSWRISDSYPNDDSEGYSKVKMPFVPDAFDLNSVIADLTGCPVLIDDNNDYYGIATGDVDGSWKDASVGTGLKSTKADAIVFDIANAYVEDELVKIPLKIVSEEIVNAFNFVVEFNSNLRFESVINHTNATNITSNTEDHAASIAYFNLKGIEVNEHIVSLRFYAPEGFNASDIEDMFAWVNNKSADARKSTTTVDATEIRVNVYPNPASDILNVQVSENSTLQLVDLNGRTMFMKSDVNGTEEISVSAIESGVYMLKIYNERQSTVKRIVISK